MRQGGNYEFKAKKLRGMHFEHKSDPAAPKVFISELMTDQFSDYLKTTIRGLPEPAGRQRLC